MAENTDNEEEKVENKVNTVHDIFNDFDDKNSISKSSIKGINIYKKQNKMLIELKTYISIPIRDFIKFEIYLINRFKLSVIDIKVNNLEIVDGVEQKKEISNTVIEKNWSDIIIYLAYKHPVTKVLLNNSRIIINDNNFNVVLARQGSKMLEARNFNRNLEEFLKNTYERNFVVNITEDIDKEAIKKYMAENKAMEQKIIDDAIKEAKENSKNNANKPKAQKSSSYGQDSSKNGNGNAKFDKKAFIQKAKENKELKAEKEELGPEDEHSPWIIPHRPCSKEIVIKDTKTNVKDIEDEMEKIYINGEILSIETRELKKMPKTLVMMDVFDGTSTITCKAFVENDSLSYVLKRLKEVKGVQILGSVKNDMYSQELSIMANRVLEGTGVTQKIKKVDNALEKRTELHLHTKMSQMDGVIDEIAAVKRAISWKHPGIAITDHDCCQSFPHVYGTVNDARKAAKKAYKAVQAKEDDLKKLEEIVNTILEKYSLDKQTIDFKVSEMYLDDKKNFKEEDENLKAEIDLFEQYINLTTKYDISNIETRIVDTLDMEETKLSVRETLKILSNLIKKLNLNSKKIYISINENKEKFEKELEEANKLESDDPETINSNDEKIETLKDNLEKLHEIYELIKELRMDKFNITDSISLAKYVVQGELEKAKKEKDYIDNFKVGYGTELDMSEDYINVIYNSRNDKLKDLTYVIFDTETTGFNPGIGDSMVEIGAVKILNGEVLDRFDKLINPGHHIDEVITSLTGISDAKVKDAENEEQVTKEFKEWIGDLPLVAHNARFDKNMLDMAYYKYNLGKLENPIIDTLMLSRVINRDLKKHNLTALAKFYKIDFDESDDEDDETSATDTAVEEGEDVSEWIEDILVDETSVYENGHANSIDADDEAKEVEIKVKLINDNVIYLEDFGPRVVELKPGKNQIIIKFSDEDHQEHEVIVPVNKVRKHHRGDYDAENTGYIFIKMLKQIDGVETLDQLEDYKLLEKLSYKNNPDKIKNIGTTCSYKNYILPLDEEHTIENTGFGYCFEEYNKLDYVWKFKWCHDDYLQMYENIPAKTFNENIANMYSKTKHVIILATNQVGLKNLFRVISFANTNFLERNARIPRKLIEENREGLLIGSACVNGEIFDGALTRSDEDLIEKMKFYDYIEVQPISNYMYLLRNHDIDNLEQLQKAIMKIINCAIKAGKLICATGDVHNLDKEDLIYREIIVNQNVPGKGRHQLARYLSNPNKRCTNEANINAVIETIKNKNHAVLDMVEEKVLRYIYILKALKSIPITKQNIIDIYSAGKNTMESGMRGKNGDAYKHEKISASLNKLKALGVISSDLNEPDLYTLNTKYTPSIKQEDSHIPNQYYRNTEEMLTEFDFIKDKDLVKDVVINNPRKVIEQMQEIMVIDYPAKPYSPIIEHSQETCRDLVYTKASSMYGDPLPRNIEERLAQEFYGDKILGLAHEKAKLEHPDFNEEQIDEVLSSVIHELMMSGYEGVVDVYKNKLLREAEEPLSEEDAITNAKAGLGGIIGGGFDVIYLIAQKLVKHSNDDGYLVGSRGSVGSSLVASMMGITECNGLPAHYYCPECQYSEFHGEDGKPYSDDYPSGFDLPEKDCPKCGAQMIHQGNDMPFATFLGFNADKVPDIDLNFSGLNQADAHEYTKVLFGTDNVYRAGTIGTVADKTAVGYVQGFEEEKMYNRLKIEAASYGIKVSGKDDLKKKFVIRSNIRLAEAKRIGVGCTGVKRTTGQHPGGIVVVPGYRDVWDFTAFQYPADDPTAEWRTTHFDYHAIDADLLKLDILGHDDPTVLRYLKDISGIEVTKIDLGDLDTMKIFKGPEILGVKPEQLRALTKKDDKGKVLKKYCPTGTLGIPEFGTAFTLGMLEDTKPSTFGELIKISGLSHGTDVWLGNAQDLVRGTFTLSTGEKIQIPFKKVIGCRDDIMVGLIQWGMKPAKAFKIMEFVRKGKASKDPATWQEHVAYMRANNIPEWYIQSCKKIKYMFPKAHATAYVTSAFRIAWFKVHHPIMYYSAYFSIRCEQFEVDTLVGGENVIRNRIDELEGMDTLSNKEDEILNVLYLALEMTCRGLTFEQIDLNRSNSNNFKIDKDTISDEYPDGRSLIIPFSALDGLGESVAKKLAEERDKEPYSSIEDLRKRGKAPSSVVEKFKALGVLDGLSNSDQMSLFG